MGGARGSMQFVKVSRGLLSLALLWAAVSFAQSPSPEQVEQAKRAVRSGTTVTPAMIEAAKRQFPGLQGLSNEQIRQLLEGERTNGAMSAEDSAAYDARTEDSSDSKADVKPGTKADTKADPKAGTKESRTSRNQGIDDSLSEAASERFPSWLRRFGHDFFENADVAGLGPNAPPLAEYILSPGDEIQVYTWGRDSRNQSVVISNDGMFHFPPLSPMRLAGLRFAQAQERIISEVQRIHGVTAEVSLGRLRSIRIMVLGEAVRPGSYTMPAGATVTSALFRSRGISDIGSLRNIEVRRGERVAATLDLYDMLLKGSTRGDIQLLPGDAIFIPLASTQVAVHGMVKRPGIYEVKAGPGLRALEAVDLAGGLRSNAFKGRIRLDRIQGNKRNIVLDVDMDKVDPKSNVRLVDGDILFVDRVLERLDDAVSLEGNVLRPGRYQYKPGMTVRDLLPGLKDLKPETFFEYAHIMRPAPDDERPTMLSFSLADVFAKGARVPLQPRDVVRIYSRYDVVERPTVTVTGTVRAPGTHSYSEAMTVSDLVLLGGGLKDAHLAEAHVLRRLKAEDSDSMYTELIRVNLGKVLESSASEENIRLKPFDVLNVLPRENFVLRRSVNIYGAVRNEGNFELSEGLGIPELINLAGGLMKSSYTLNVEVARKTVVGDSIMIRTILKQSLKDILEGRATFALQDGDGVYIREVINSREYASIMLGGEFNFPGRYEFSPGEKLSSVIRRAGGFSPEAYLRGAVFLRHSVREQQLRHAEEVGRRLEGQLQGRLQQTTQEAERAGILLAMDRRKQLLEEIARAPYLGRVVVNVDRRLKFAGTDWDLELENGDSLYVGPRVSTVSVLGEVSSPTTLIHTRKTDQVGEVLAKAGGVNTYGDYEETFYIAPDGAISTPRTAPWYSSFKCKKIEPGGTIIVPLKPPAKDYLEIWAQATQILYQLAISVGVAYTVF
jgi:polysaccharide export outer membrane protein